MASQWSLQQYQSALAENSKRSTLVIENAGTICGFLVAHEIDGEWEIENLAVAEKYRCGGLGTQLVREFLQLARRRAAKQIFLEVRESNSAARRLYERCGFVEAGHRNDYYRDPDEDAIVYRVMLS